MKRDSATTFTDCSLSCLRPIQMDFVFESGGIKKVLFLTTVHSNQDSHATSHTLTSSSNSQFHVRKQMRGQNDKKYRINMMTNGVNYPQTAMENVEISLHWIIEIN